VAAIAVWVVFAFSVKRTKVRQPISQRLLYLLLTVVVAVLLNRSIKAGHLSRVVIPHTLATGILADTFVFAGLLIAVWARLTLGGNWSARVTLKEDHELIQSGPYRLVRHPIYSGFLLMILGTAVLASRASAFVALAICFVGFWIKLRQEEELLRRNLPGYAEYISRTKALIPFIW
jgi:protein-S-isoprenylcysteine O-methyltransferase Ste14